jgi:hypothetical protein
VVVGPVPAWVVGPGMSVRQIYIMVMISFKNKIDKILMLSLIISP